MKATKIQFERWFVASLRVSLLLVVAASLMSTTGCSWFKRKKTGMEDTQTTEQYQDTTPMPAGPPTDAADEGRRPGDLLPFPELQVIYFDYDASNIRADQLDKMEANLQYLLNNPGDRVLIEGHCDERGTVEYNFALGERRANAVRDYYVQGGIDAERIAILSKGEEEPVATGHDEAAWSQNRRAEFKRMM